jgi:hypothetical protein
MNLSRRHALGFAGALAAQSFVVDFRASNWG